MNLVFLSRDLALLCCIAFLVLCTHHCVSEPCNVRGVKKSECARYEGTTFNCGDPSKTTIDSSLINDDFCDCPNGTDEPGTSACSLFSIPRARIPNVRSEEQNVYYQSRFWCINRGYRGEYIYSSHVNDGICDCCDGSDEWKGHVECADNCRSLAEESLRDLREKEVRFSAALKTRDSLQRNGQRIVKDKSERKEMLDELIQDLQTKVDDLDSKKNDLQNKQNEWRESRKIEERSKLEKEVAENPDLLKQQSSQSDNDDDNDDDSGDMDEMSEEDARAQAERQLDEEFESDEEFKKLSPRKQRKRRRQRRRELQREIRQRYRNKNRRSKRDKKKKHRNKRHKVSFDKPKDEEKEDGTVQKQNELDNEFPYSDEYRPPENTDASPEEDEDFPYPDEYRPKDDARDEDDDGEYVEEEEFEDPDEGAAEDNVDSDSTDEQFERLLQQRTDEGLDVDHDYQQFKQDLENAKTEWRNAKDDLREKKRELEELESFIGIGLTEENSAWASLFGECFTANVAKYTYEICPFKSAAQKEGSSSTSLGSFDAFNVEQGKIKMKFDRGQSCWKGPKRSLTVTFECDSKSGFSSVSEPATCTYEALFSTPLACSHAELKQIREIIDNQFKDEL